jgi:hypothetical protein
MSKECPACRLVNPDLATRCDCGYDFSAGRRGPEHTRSVWRTVVILAILFTCDAVLYGQGILSLLVACVGATVLLVGTLVSAIRGARARARSRLLRVGTYLLLGAATVGVTSCHRRMAARQADRVIAACRAYKAEHGDFPERLQDLVPRYFDAVPRAKATLAWGEFMYWTTPAADGSRKSQHVLMYRDMPPAGRRLYHFEEARWTRLD